MAKTHTVIHMVATHNRWHPVQFFGSDGLAITMIYFLRAAMKHRLFTVLILIILVALMTSNSAQARDKVVVIPMIGNDTELKPIRMEDVFVRRLSLENGRRGDLFTTDANNAYVLTSMHVYLKEYPNERGAIGLQLDSSALAPEDDDVWYVPNDTYTVIEFGSGYLLESNSPVTWEINPFTALNVFIDFYGYRVKK